MKHDPSNGYEAAAKAFMEARSGSGRERVATWAASLPPGSSVVDVGAGHGEPLTSVLVKRGLCVWAIDASPTLVAAFKKNVPDIEIACEAAEKSSFFGRKFDAALAVGLIFLLREDAQSALIRRLSSALNSGGKLLFSAPWQIGSWQDLLTNQTSWSLGKERYQQLLEEADCRLVDTYGDEGGSHYYEAVKL